MTKELKTKMTNENLLIKSNLVECVTAKKKLAADLRVELTTDVVKTVMKAFLNNQLEALKAGAAISPIGEVGVLCFTKYYWAKFGCDCYTCIWFRSSDKSSPSHLKTLTYKKSPIVKRELHQLGLNHASHILSKGEIQTEVRAHNTVGKLKNMLQTIGKYYNE